MQLLNFITPDESPGSDKIFAFTRSNQCIYHRRQRSSTQHLAIKTIIYIYTKFNYKIIIKLLALSYIS